MAGMALGHQFDRGLTGLDADPTPRPGAEATRRERTQAAFFTATFAVMGHLSKADGRVSADEIRLASQVMDQMSLPPHLREAAQRLFREGKTTDFPLDELLAQLRRECRGSTNLLRVFLEIQVSAALADGAMHAAERRVLAHIVSALGLPATELDRIVAMLEGERRHHRGPVGRERMPVDAAYEILGVDHSATDDEVKRAYRRLMSQHHPDRLIAKGLPEEMVAVATEKSKEVRLAYERIREARAA